MAPRTRKPSVRRKLNHGLRDGDEMEEQENEQPPYKEVSQKSNQKQVTARTTRRSTANQNARSGFQDNQQRMEHRQQGTGPRTRKATGNQSDCGGLQDQNQMDGDGQRQNEELDFRMTQQTNVSAPRTQRSTVKRNLNHGLLDEDDMGEHEQQENEQHSNLEVTEALQNALKILTAFSTRREITNQNSHCEFQEKHQQQQLQPAISQQVSMMAPTTRKATRNQLGYHRLRDEIQIEGDRQHQEEEQPDFQMTQQVMAPSARRPTAKRKLNHVLIDEDEIEEHELQQNEQQPPVEFTKEIENALKILLAPSTQRETTNLNSRYGLRDKHQVKENGQLQNRQQLQPQINHQASMMAPRTQKATTNQSGYHRLRDEGQMQRDRQHHNEEQPEFQSTQQTKTQHVMARSTQRSTAKRKVNNVLLDEDEVEEHGQQGNEHPSELEVSQAIENALKILMAPSTRGATNENSHCGFQEKHQMKESMHQQSRQQQQPQFSQQASISAVVPSRIQNAASNRRGYHRLQDEDPMEENGQHQHEEPPEIQRTQSRQQQPQFSRQVSISAVVPPRSQNTARNQRGYHRLQDEDSMEEDEQHQHEEPPEIQRTRQTNDKNGTVGTIKRVRGPTFMREVWGKNSNEERIIVNFNKRGQPVGPNKKTFTGFLGTIARNGKYAPLDIEDWRKVSQENKDAMINMVKERFEVPEGSEHWILLSIGKKRNSWRSRVKTQYFDPGLPIENQTHNKPPRVDEDQWKNLLTYWANEDVMEACERNRVHGQQSAMNQTTGKLSFAEIEEELRERLGRSPSRAEMFAACFTHRDGNPSTHEVGVALARMKEYQSKLPPDSQDPVGPNDSFAKVVGNDPPGKVRMLGLGPNPSDLWGSIPSRSTCYRMVLENQAAMTRIEEKVEQFTKLIGSLQERMQPQQNPNNVLKTRIPISPGQSSNSNFIGHKLQVGDSVLLKSLFDHNKIVAKGCLESASPDQYVGGRRLGSNWCAVQISVPMEWDEDLIRPYSNFSTIGDAIGTSVAWPCHLVINEDLQE